MDQAGARGEREPDEPGPAVLDTQLRPAERREQLRSRARTFGRECREALALGFEVGFLPQRGELSLQLADASFAIDPGVREVVTSADEVQRGAHQRRLDDVPPRDCPREIVGAKAVNP